MKNNYNIIAVIDAAGENALFCLRRKQPYQGLYNFVGGKIEPGEAGIDAAYRELFEETGICRDDISLMHLMSMQYPLEDTLMEVYAGRLARSVALVVEENALEWIPLTEDLADVNRFAGVGNLKHAIEYIRKFTDLL